MVLHYRVRVSNERYRSGKGWQIRIAPKSLRKIKKKMKEQTQRKAPGKVEDKIKKMESTIVGWVNYFRIAKSKMEELDSWVTMRLRMGIWKPEKVGYQSGESL